MSEDKCKHTKGEWIAVGYWVEHPDDKVADICDCNPECMGQGHLGRTPEEIVANARLIAAAPELLTALQAIVKTLADQDDEGLIEHVQPMIDARAAIAKAIGEQA